MLNKRFLTEDQINDCVFLFKYKNFLKISLLLDLDYVYWTPLICWRPSLPAEPIAGPPIFITPEIVAEAMQKMKQGKAPGPLGMVKWNV